MNEGRTSAFVAAQLYTALDDGDWPAIPTGPVTARPVNSSIRDLVAAATGHADTDTLTRIADDSASRASLARLWRADPPDTTLVAQAWRDQGTLLDLLTELHLADDTPVARTNQQFLTELDALEHAPAISPIQISARHREDYVLGATTAQVADVDEFPGGRLIRQRFDDGSTEVTVVITNPDLGHTSDVMRLASADHDLTVLIILLPGMTPDTHLVGRIQPDNDKVYDNLELTGPFPIASLTAEELAAVTAGVAWSGVDAVNAWDAAARATGDPGLAAAIDRGIDLS